MKIDLTRIITKDSAEAEDAKVVFVRQKADFVPLSNVPLGAVQLNIGYETLDGKPERKAMKNKKGETIKDASGTPVLFTPLRCKLTKAGNSRGATLMSGKFPLAYRVAQLAVPLDPDVFTQSLTKAAASLEEMKLSPVFGDPEEPTE